MNKKGFQCESCGEVFHHYGDEISWYDINGNTVTDLELNSQNPDALHELLCTECAGNKGEIDYDYDCDFNKEVIKPDSCKYCPLKKCDYDGESCSVLS